MKSVYKLLIDIGPLAVFFIFYTRNGLQASILPFMIATVIAVLFSYILEKKIPIMPTVGATIVLLFGGLTIYFDNEVFFKMKPTIINLLFAAILYGGILINKSLLKYLLGAALKLEEEGWKILTQRWIGFFIALASGLFGFSVVWHMLIPGIIGFLAIIFIMIFKSFNTDVDYYVKADQVREIEMAHMKEATS